MTSRDSGLALVTGGSGFIGRALIPVLQARGFRVVATSRRPRASAHGVVWRTCDLLDSASLPEAFEGVRVAYYLVHSMGSGGANFRDLERRTAEAFVANAARAGVERIVYLGWPCAAWSAVRAPAKFSTAIETKSSLLLFIFADPLLDSIKDDPRYFEFHKIIYHSDKLP